jgi:hypothetical protein
MRQQAAAAGLPLFICLLFKHMFGTENFSNCCCRYKVPLLVVGGGGYTLRNVARCWAYETGRLMGHDLPDNLPESVLNSFNYYMDNQRLRIEVCSISSSRYRSPTAAAAGRSELLVSAGWSLSKQ